MDQVNKCIDKMSEVITAAQEGKFEVIEDLTYEVSKLEHQADQIKDDIRESLLKRFFHCKTRWPTRRRTFAKS